MPETDTIASPNGQQHDRRMIRRAKGKGGNGQNGRLVLGPNRQPASRTKDDVGRLVEAIAAMVEELRAMLLVMADIAVGLNHPPAVESRPLRSPDFPGGDNHVANIDMESPEDDRVELFEPDVEVEVDDDPMAELAAQAQELGLYEDDAPPEATEDDYDRIWAGRMKMHAMRLWKREEWGPPPGSEGCRVPAHLLPRSRRR